MFNQYLLLIYITLIGFDTQATIFYTLSSA